MKNWQVGDWKITVARPEELTATPLHPEQVHGGIIVQATELSKDAVPADGVLVNTADQPVAIKTADCLPVVLASDEAALLLHVSRKSLAAGLLDEAPKYLDPASITRTFFGPHICAKHFTFDHIGSELQQFIDKFPEAVTLGRPIRLSLAKAVEQYLKQWGIKDIPMTHDGRCTYEDPELLSYRRSLKQGKHLTDRFYTIVRKSPL